MRLSFHRQPERRRRSPSPVAAPASGEASRHAGTLRTEVLVLDERPVGERVVRGETERVPLRCLIVDDNARFLETARFLLEREGVTVAGVASTAAEALRLAPLLRPDVVLVDIMLGTESGFELARRLVANDPDGRSSVILISTHAEADFADLIAESPAAGFLAKAELSANAIRGIHDSHTR